jgi:hypothetical protein
VRRFFSLITVVALSAAMLLLSAVTAFADPNMDHSSCFGQYASTKETQDAGPGASVRIVATELAEIPGGNEHSAQVLQEIRKGVPGC